MAKVQQKSEKITAFGGIFFVLDKFGSILSSVIDSHLGLRSTLIGYQYSEIIRAIFSVFCCGGDCIEDLNLYLKDVLTERPHTRVPSADTVLRGIEELATENISYTVEKTGNVYDFNTAFIASVMEHAPVAAQAYYLKESMREIWMQVSKSKAESVMEDWIRQARSTKVPLIECSSTR